MDSWEAMRFVGGCLSKKSLPDPFVASNYGAIHEWFLVWWQIHCGKQSWHHETQWNGYVIGFSFIIDSINNERVVFKSCNCQTYSCDMRAHDLQSQWCDNNATTPIWCEFWWIISLACGHMEWMGFVFSLAIMIRKIIDANDGFLVKTAQNVLAIKPPE